MPRPGAVKVMRLRRRHDTRTGGDRDGEVGTGKELAASRRRRARASATRDDPPTRVRSGEGSSEATADAEMKGEKGIIDPRGRGRTRRVPRARATGRGYPGLAATQLGVRRREVAQT